MTAVCSGNKSNSAILFFILDFLLLFYDGRSIGICRRNMAGCAQGDSNILFFILVFLLLFY